MNKVLLTNAIFAIIFGLNLSTIATPIVTADQKLPDHVIHASFQSFCLERNEYLSFDETYCEDVSNVTLNGSGSSPSTKWLDPRTAWLNIEFYDEMHSCYDLDGFSRTCSTYSFQHPTGYLKDKLSWMCTGSLAEQFFEVTHACDWYLNDCMGDMPVLHLYENPDLSSYKQDQIIHVAATSTSGFI